MNPEVWVKLIGFFGAGSSLTFILFLLPAMLELKKPRDAGPRILCDFGLKPLFDVFPNQLKDIEGNQELLFSFASEKAFFVGSILDVEANCFF